MDQCRLPQTVLNEKTLHFHTQNSFPYQDKRKNFTRKKTLSKNDEINFLRKITFYVSKDTVGLSVTFRKNSIQYQEKMELSVVLRDER